MPRIERVAAVSWAGNLSRGSGRISAETSGAFVELPFSVATRVGDAEGRTSPEELLAAAHAGCYAMSLASELTESGTPPEHLDVRCTIVMDEIEGAGHRIVASELAVRGRVAGIDAEAFARASQAADAGCPFSHLIRASGAVTVSAALA
jgi:osmotically inducible protein OsmC